MNTRTCYDCKCHRAAGEVWLDFAEDGMIKSLCPSCRTKIFIPKTRMAWNVLDNILVYLRPLPFVHKVESPGFLGF